MGDLVSPERRSPYRFRDLGRRPAGALPVEHALVQRALDCLQEQGVTGRPKSGSTDANIPLSLGLPVVVLGTTMGAGARTPNESIDIPPLSQGTRQILRVVTRLGGTA